MKRKLVVSLFEIIEINAVGTVMEYGEWNNYPLPSTLRERFNINYNRIEKHNII